MIANFEKVSIVCALALLTRVLTVWFRPVIEITYSYAIYQKTAVRAISVFQKKFGLEFTRQAVNFSIQFLPKAGLHATATPNARILNR